MRAAILAENRLPRGRGANGTVPACAFYCYCCQQPCSTFLSAASARCQVASCRHPKHLFVAVVAWNIWCSNSRPTANPRWLPTDFVKVDLEFSQPICSSATQGVQVSLGWQQCHNSYPASLECQPSAPLPSSQAGSTALGANWGITDTRRYGHPNLGPFSALRRTATAAAVRRSSSVAARREHHLHGRIDVQKPRS